MTTAFLTDLHVKYIQSLDTERDNLEYWLTEHLRVNGIYWGLTALALMGHTDALDKQKVIEYIKTCQHPNGGFGGHTTHDPHLLYTLSAVQILSIYDRLSEIDTERVVSYVASLFNSDDGSFRGDEWGEIDARFNYCALNCLSLLGRLESPDASVRGGIDVEKAVGWILRCKNHDGGFGSTPGSESHAGLTFVCVASLAITDSLRHIDIDLLGWWLCERQLKNGGLNGRPEKLEDVCYSWWVLSSLSIIGRLHWINRETLIQFILSAQDHDAGGIADRPGDMTDVFHTLFGIAGLSLLGYEGLKPVDPVYCLPREVIKRIGLPERYTI